MREKILTLSKGSEARKLMRIAWPVTLSQLGHISVGVADSMMLGKLGSIELAASTIGLSVFIPFMMLGIGVSYGLSPLVAKADGENNAQKISSILKHGFVLNIGFGAILSVILWYGSSFLRFLDQPAEIIGFTTIYFQWLAASMFPLMLYQALKQFAEGLSITRPAMFISISGNLLNIFLNYLFIFGKLGMPAMGVEGAAMTTFVSRIYMGVVLLLYIRWNSQLRYYISLLKNIAFQWKEIITLSKTSFPIGTQLSFESGAFGFAAIMAGWLGTKEIAAHQIALNLASVTYMAATGLASAATVRVGYGYGKKAPKQIYQSGKTALRMVLVFMLCNATLFMVFRSWMPGLYIASEEIITMASSLLLITAFFQLSDGLQCVSLGILRGLGDVKLPTMVALIAYWIIGLPVGYILAFKKGLGLVGIWYGFLIGLSIAAVLLIYRFRLKISRMLKDSSVTDPSDSKQELEGSVTF